MPIYEYEPDGNTCEHCQGGFEAMQSFDDDPLTACPECGQPCHRVISAFAVCNRVGDVLSDKNLKAKGFTQYKKTDEGKYQKTFGDGPNLINRD